MLRYQLNVLMNVRKKSEKATVVLNYIKVLKNTLVNSNGSVIDQCNQIPVNECDLTMAKVCTKLFSCFFKSLFACDHNNTLVLITMVMASGISVSLI